MSILRVWEHALCLVVAVNVGPAKQCWTERRDYHGPDGTPRKLNWLHECQSACINDSRCEAIDWEPSNVGKTCWILTSTAIKETTKHGVITNYQLDRTCLGESCFYDQTSAFRLCHVAYLSETVIICHFIQITLNDFYRASALLAMQCAALATFELSVLHLSVTRWHCVKTTQARVAKSSSTDSPRTPDLA